MAGKKIIGIDLGTTNSVVAVYEGGEPAVIANTQGSRLTPSVVGFQNDGTRVVGRLAKNQAVQNPKNTVFSIKRFMGRRHNEVAEQEKMVPYEVVGSPDDPVKVKINENEYTAPEISAMVLRFIKEYCEEYLGEAVSDAVITVPAYFNDAQRQATKDAGVIAGLNVRRIVNEPTAAALSYGLTNKKDGIIAVFDLGGGTFDVSILEISQEGEEQVFEVRATNGDTRLGGDDFDELLIHHVADEFQQQHDIDLRKDLMALQRLKEACEKAKCELSSTVSTSINLPFISQGADKNAIHLNTNVTRAKFEQLLDPMLRRLFEPCRQCLKDADMKPEQIAEVILVGGSTRIPKIQEVCEEIFRKKPSKQLNPDEVVALGAAVQGHILADPQNASITFLDVTPLSLGIEVEGGLMAVLIDRNTTIPCQRKEAFTTASDSQTMVDVCVYQGERKIAKDNRKLGNFRLDGIPPARRGIPQIEVSFDIDANGILDVAAKDLATANRQHITVESSSGISKQEIQNMKDEAEKHASDDDSRKVAIEVRNDAEQLAYRAEDMLRDNGDKITSEQKQSAEKAIAELRSKFDKEVSDIQAAHRDLEKVLSEIASSMYAKAQAAHETETEAPEPEEVEVVDVEVVDAEVTDAEVIDAEVIDVEGDEGEAEPDSQN